MVGNAFSFSQRSCSQPAHNSKNCWLSISTAPTLCMPEQPHESCNVSTKDACDSADQSEHIPISNQTAEIDPGLSFSPLSCQSVRSSPGPLLYNEQEVFDAKKRLFVDPHLNVINQSPEELAALNIEIENSKSPVTASESRLSISAEKQVDKAKLDYVESSVKCLNQSQLHTLQFPSFEEKKSTSENISSEELSSQNLSGSGSLFESRCQSNDVSSVGQNKADLILCNPCHHKIEAGYEQEEEKPFLNEENIGFDINQEQIKKSKDLPRDITNNNNTISEELCASNISSFLNKNFSNGITDDFNVSPTISETIDECCMSNADKLNHTIFETVDECCMSNGITDQTSSETVDECCMSNGITDPTISETIDECCMSNGITDQTSSETVDECCMSNGITDPTISETVDECCMSNGITDQTSFQTVDECCMSNGITDQTSFQTVDECCMSNGITDQTSSETVDECCMSNSITDPTSYETVDECCMSEEIQREPQIENLCVILKNEIQASNATSHENKSNHSSYSQHQQNPYACKIDASPGPTSINHEITELHSIHNIEQQDCDQTKVDYTSDEDIPCSQLIHVITHKMSSTWKGNDKNYNSNNGIGLTFSPLYQACSQDEVAPSCRANTPGSPTLPKIIQFSPLRSLDASFACNIPIQKATDELELSPCCEIKNTALKSVSYLTLNNNLVESYNEREITNDEDQENSRDEVKTNEKPSEHNRDLEYFSSLYQFEHVQTTTSQNSDQSDEIPTLAVFSPLSSCKVDCEIEGKKSGETDTKSQVDADDDIHLMTNQIVPDYGTKIQKLPNQNEILADKEDCDTDVKSCKKETCDEPVQVESHKLSNEDPENIHYRIKAEVDFPKDSEIGESQLFQEENNSFNVNACNNIDRRVKGYNVNSTFIQQQHILNDDEGHCFEDGTGIQSIQHKLNEQVVPENSLMSVHEGNLGDSSLYGQKNKVTKERKPNVLEPFHSSFQWKSVYGSVILENATGSNQSTADCLESIIPLPSPVKRARPLRVGLSKRQKVRHLHEK